MIRHRDYVADREARDPAFRKARRQGYYAFVVKRARIAVRSRRIRNNPALQGRTGEFIRRPYPGPRP